MISSTDLRNEKSVLLLQEEEPIVYRSVRARAYLIFNCQWHTVWTNECCSQSWSDMLWGVCAHKQAWSERAPSANMHSHAWTTVLAKDSFSFHSLVSTPKQHRLSNSLCLDWRCFNSGLWNFSSPTLPSYSSHFSWILWLNIVQKCPYLFVLMQVGIVNPQSCL